MTKHEPATPEDKTYIVMFLVPPAAVLPDGSKMDSYISRYQTKAQARQLATGFIRSIRKQTEGTDTPGLTRKVVDAETKVWYHKDDHMYPMVLVAPETGKVWAPIKDHVTPLMTGKDNTLARNYYRQMALAESQGKLMRKTKPKITKGGIMLVDSVEPRDVRRYKEAEKGIDRRNRSHKGSRPFGSNRNIENNIPKKDRDAVEQRRLEREDGEGSEEIGFDNS